MNAAFTTLLSVPDFSKIIEFSTPTVWEWLIQVLNLFVMIWILKKILFKPVTEFLEKRRLGIEKNLSEAASAKINAETMKKDYETKIAKINEEASSILKQAREKSLAREQEIIKAAHVEAEAIKAKAMQDIVLEQQRVQSEMKQEMIEVATLMAGKFVQTEMNHSKQNELIGELIQEMGDVQWLNK